MWFRLSGIYMHLYSFWKTWLFKIIFKKNTNKIFGHLNSKFKGRSGPPQKGHFEEPGPGAGVQFGDAPSHWSQKNLTLRDKPLVIMEYIAGVYERIPGFETKPSCVTA